MENIVFTLNGEKRRIGVEPNETLLEMLRERLGVRSVKCGCDRGDCGACTALLDGKSVRTCLILAVEVNGRELTTIEGLSEDGLTDLQEAFIEHNSFQCGYCAPAVTVAATELLRRNPDPTEEEIKEALSGNLCRCTGYKPIIEAVLAVARNGGGGD